MGLPPRDTEGAQLMPDDHSPKTKSYGFSTRMSHAGRAGTHVHGFVNPGVGTNGKLQTAGGLPTNANQYTQLLVTRETQGNPKTPGSIILQGGLNLG